MKKEGSSIIDLLKTGFWTTVGGGIAIGFWKLLVKYTTVIPGTAIRLITHLIPSQKEAVTISHILYLICIPLFLVPFSYVFWRENRYVLHMYVKRDALEAGKIKPSDLTLEEFTFIKSHWPDLFPPTPNKS